MMLPCLIFTEIVNPLLRVVACLLQFAIIQAGVLGQLMVGMNLGKGTARVTPVPLKALSQQSGHYKAVEFTVSITLTMQHQGN